MPEEPKSRDEERKRLQLDWRIAKLGGVFAIIGAVVGGFLAGLSGALYQSGAEDRRVLREQQAEVHSGLLSATTRFLLTVPRARSVAQGGSAARVEWDRMRAEFATVLDAAALSQVLGSSDASEAAEEVEDDARRLREALDDMNTAAGPDTPPLIAAVASGIAELERSKADYLAAARRDLIVHDDPDAR